MPDDWKQLGEDALAVIGSLATRRLSLQRSSKIVHYLGRENQPLGGALTELRALTARYQSGQKVEAGAWDELAELARAWRKPSTRNRLIEAADEAVSSPQQRRNAIVADARKGLLDAVDEVADLIETGLALRARHGASGAANAKDSAVLANALGALGEIPLESAGDAALSRLVDWLRSDEQAPLATDPLDRLVEAALKPLFEIPRDADGRPERTPTLEELEVLVHGRDPMSVARGYLALGNRKAVDETLTAAAIPHNDALDDELLRARRLLVREHQEAVVRADRVVARMRALSDDEQARGLALRIEELRTPDEDRFDLAMVPLVAVHDEGLARLAVVREGLYERVNRLADPEVGHRIQMLIEGDDEPLAVEYLTLAEAGEALPTLEPPPGDDFARFFPALVELAAAADKTRATAVGDVRAALGAVEQPSNRVLSQGLKAWRDLTEQKQGGSPGQFGERIASVVRLLGLVPRSDSWLRSITRTRRAGYASFEVSCSPLDRSYVPGLGTQTHGRYDVTLVWDEASPQRLLQFVDDDRRSRANIILYFGTMTVRQRLRAAQAHRAARLRVLPIGR